jgi:hypothetical protein
MRVYTRRFALGYLGQTDADFARAEFARSWKLLQNETSYLANARPSDWEFRATQTAQIASNTIKFLKEKVLGKTGNPEAEEKLLAAWEDILVRANQMLQNKPSIWEQIKDKAALYLTDFWGGVQKAQRSFTDWLVTHAGDLLSTYHKAVTRLIAIENEFGQLLKTGKISEQEAQTRRSQIERAKSILETIRAAYRSISGGSSIDELAQKEYGPYPKSLSGWPFALLKAAAMAAVYALIAMFVQAINIIPEIKSAVASAKSAAITVTKSGEDVSKFKEAIAKLKEDIELFKSIAIALAVIAAVVGAHVILRKKE